MIPNCVSYTLRYIQLGLLTDSLYNITLQLSVSLHPFKPLSRYATHPAASTMQLIPLTLMPCGLEVTFSSFTHLNPFT